MNDSGMNEFARQDVRAVLDDFGIVSARRAIGTDATEEVILLSSEDFGRVNPETVTAAIMNVLPHVKVLVIQEHPSWRSEPL